MRKYDDFFIVNGLPIVVKNTNNPSYDFDFRKYFRCKSVVDIPDEYVLYRVGAISDDMLDGKLAEDIKVEPMMPREVHNRCAKLSDWYPHIEEYTIKSKVYNKFPSNDEIKKDFDFPIFVKGNRQTDHHKKELSVIKDIEQLEVLRNEWNKNSILFWQEVVVREYVSLKIIDDKSFPEMMPISYEFRFFVWNNRIVGYGPYWTMGKKYSLLDEELPEVRKLVETVSHKLKVPFIAVDVAKTVDDRWIVIEVNDAQESGYVGANPNEIWSNILDGYEEAINKIPKFLRKAPLKLDTREYHSYSSITEEKDSNR